MSTVVRMLGPGDERALEAFLTQHADSSMFLRANARAVGLEDRDAPLHATYVAAFEADAIVAVSAHSWNGMVLVQAPTVALDEVVRAAVAQTDRPIAGVSGPFRQVVAARRALGLEAAPTSMDARDDLFALSLDRLVVPSALEGGALRCIAPRDEDRALITTFRVDYCVETLGDDDSPALRESCRGDIERLCARGGAFVLLDRERVVAFSGFNAELPDCVQLGGVFTPKGLRGRGYARAVVAGSLLFAREKGVSRAILFTSVDNVAARTAYLSLGFAVIGDYGLVRFRSPSRAPSRAR